MINPTLFRSKIEELYTLIGQKPNSDQASLIFKRLKDMDERDFRTACDDDEMILELGRMKMNYPTLKNFMEKHRNKRLNVEWEKAKEQEKRDVERLLKNENLGPEIRAFLQGFGRRES